MINLNVLCNNAEWKRSLSIKNQLWIIAFLAWGDSPLCKISVNNESDSAILSRQTPSLGADKNDSNI